MVDAASSVTDETATPREGDIAVCAYCGNFNQYNEDLSLRTMERETLNEIRASNPDAYSCMKKLQYIIVNRASPS